MKAAVLREVGTPLTIEDVAVARPGPREILIRTVATGVCHSDLNFIEGYFPSPLPLVLGHESAGIVEEVGSEVRSVKPGDHVVTCPSVFCGHCSDCVTGHMAMCASPDTRRRKGEPQRLSLPNERVVQFSGLGSFAEQLLVHENACVAIRPEMPLDLAALLGCAVVTGVGAVMNTAQVRPGETVAIIGCGGVGLAAINGAAIAGAGRIIAVDRIASKLDLARQFGATDIVDASAGDPVAQVRELTRGGVDHCFEMIGLKATTEQAFQMLGRRGTATIVGITPMGTKIELNATDLLDEKRLQGSYMGSNRFPVDIPRLVDFYLSGRLKLDELVSRRIGLHQINEAFAEMKSGQFARSVIMFDQP